MSFHEGVLTAHNRRFDASDALRIQESFLERKHHIYGSHISACRARLERYIRQHPDMNYMIYPVPLVIVGASLRSPRSIINHIIDALNKSGFHAQYIGQNYIFIRWEYDREAMQQYAVKDHVAEALLHAQRHGAPQYQQPRRQQRLQHGGGGRARSEYSSYSSSVGSEYSTASQTTSSSGGRSRATTSSYASLSRPPPRAARSNGGTMAISAPPPPRAFMPDRERTRGILEDLVNERMHLYQPSRPLNSQ